MRTRTRDSLSVFGPRDSGRLGDAGDGMATYRLSPQSSSNSLGRALPMSVNAIEDLLGYVMF